MVWWFQSFCVFRYGTNIVQLSNKFPATRAHRGQVGIAPKKCSGGQLCTWWWILLKVFFNQHLVKELIVLDRVMAGYDLVFLVGGLKWIILLLYFPSSKLDDSPNWHIQYFWDILYNMFCNVLQLVPSASSDIAHPDASPTECVHWPLTQQTESLWKAWNWPQTTVLGYWGAGFPGFECFDPCEPVLDLSHFANVRACTFWIDCETMNFPKRKLGGNFRLKQYFESATKYISKFRTQNSGEKTTTWGVVLKQLHFFSAPGCAMLEGDGINEVETNWRLSGDGKKDLKVTTYNQDWLVVWNFSISWDDLEFRN